MIFPGNNSRRWSTAPISQTCEFLISPSQTHQCGKPAVRAYKAMNHGWMALCEECSKPHLKYSELIDSLVERGEKTQPITTAMASGKRGSGE